MTELLNPCKPRFEGIHDSKTSGIRVLWIIFKQHRRSWNLCSKQIHRNLAAPELRFFCAFKPFEIFRYARTLTSCKLKSKARRALSWEIFLHKQQSGLNFAPFASPKIRQHSDLIQVCCLRFNTVLNALFWNICTWKMSLSSLQLMSVETRFLRPLSPCYPQFSAIVTTYIGWTSSSLGQELPS